MKKYKTSMVKRTGGCILLSLAMLSMMIPLHTFADAERVENVNVALGKTVYAGDTARSNQQQLTNGLVTDIITPSDTYGGGAAVLPSGAETAAAAGNADDWFIIDLGRKYPVSEVKVWPRQDSEINNSVYMSNFVVEASNYEDFPTESTVELGGVNGSYSETKEAAVLSGDGEYYRYIRLRKTSGTYHIYSEIEVFANATQVKENVASGKSAVDNNGAEVATLTDGNATNGPNGLSTSAYFTIDLEKDCYISQIKLHNGDYGGVVRINRLYYMKIDVSKSPDFPDDETTKRVVETDWGTITPSTSILTDTEVVASLEGNEGYRYVRIYSPTTGEYAYGEIEVYETAILPEVAGVEFVSANTLTVSFTDKMKAESFTAETVSLGKDGPSFVSAELGSGFDEGYDVTLTFDGEIYGQSLILTKDVVNERGVGLEKDYTSYTVPNAVTIGAFEWSGITGSGESETSAPLGAIADVAEKDKITAVVEMTNIASANAKGVCVAALYNESNFIVAMGETRFDIATGIEPTEVKVGFDVPKELSDTSAYTMKVYIWKEFDLMRPWINSVTFGE